MGCGATESGPRAERPLLPKRKNGTGGGRANKNREDDAGAERSLGGATKSDGGQRTRVMIFWVDFANGCCAGSG